MHPDGGVKREVSDRSARVAFGPWWLLCSGPVSPTGAHVHHAFELVVHAGSPLVVDVAGHPAGDHIVVVDPDMPHAYRDHRDHVLVAYIDPECDVGRQLATRHTPNDPSESQSHPVFGVIGGLRVDNWSRAEEAVQRMVANVCEQFVLKPMSWWRHPAIDAALPRLPDDADGNVDVAELAAEVGLSVVRLTHVLRDEIGMPIRSYIRWMRLVNATERLAMGVSTTEAARDAGFVDGAHFIRTFQSMFGLSPSDAVGSGIWLTP